MKLFQCQTCGTILYLFDEKKSHITCCGEDVKEIHPDQLGSIEHHVPVVVKDENQVDIVISAAKHPMDKSHYVRWIILETTQGMYLKYLDKNKEPETRFFLDNGEEIVCVYEYCNLHNLWKSHM